MQLSGKEKKRQLAARSDLKTFGLLTKKWPKVFNLKTPRPLKVGIHQDIIDACKRGGVPPFLFLRELNSWVNRLSYLKSLTKMRTRYDLQGRGVGMVTDAEKDQAIRRYTSLRMRMAKSGHVKPNEAEQRHIEKIHAERNMRIPDDETRAAEKRAKERAREKRKKANRRARRLAEEAAAAQKQETPKEF